MNNHTLVFLIFVGFLLCCTQVLADESVESDVYYLLYGGFIRLELQAYQVFPNQTFLATVTIKTNQSYGANTFNVTIELPSNFTLVYGIYSYPNPLINESTNYEWNTTWLVNSSNALPGIYTINASEDLFNQRDSDSITVNSGPTPSYNITVSTDKSSYSAGESGVVFARIFDSNNYPFNLDGICNSTVYYPDNSPTAFFNVRMVYVSGSAGEYVSSRGFQVWANTGTYTVEVNCTNPEGYASNNFGVSMVTTTTPATTTPPGPGPSPAPAPAPPRISNFTLDKDLIKIELKSGETDKQSVKVSNTGKTKLKITGRIQYLDDFLFFTGIKTEYTFELSPNETEELELNFIVKKDKDPGVYPGKIVFTGDSLERTVSVVVEVESEKPLFDVKVEVLPEYRIVYPGDRVIAQLTLYNLGGIERVNAELEYGVKSLDGKIIKSGNEKVTVETQFSTTKTIDLPTALKPGSYVFYSEVSYEGITGTGSSMFEVIERKRIELYVILFLLLLIIAIIVIISVFYLRKKYGGVWGKLYEKWRPEQF